MSTLAFLLVVIAAICHASWNLFAKKAGGYVRFAMLTAILAHLSVVYPLVRGTGPLLSSMTAVVVLGETLSALGLSGVLAVAAGVILVAGGVMALALG